MKKFILISLIFIFAGCGVTTDFEQLEKFMQGKDCASATEFMKKSEKEYGDNAKLLYLLDSSLIQMQCGDYTKANLNFHEADDLAQELWTNSISKNVAAMATNDLVIPYAGEDFERALINLFSAMSYLKLQKFDEAMVEIRRLDILLQSYNDEYEKKNVYSEDAFARYISAILNESDRELDDAYIDYYKSYKIYKTYTANYGTPMPSILVEDLLRTAQATDRLDDAMKLVPDALKVKYKKYKDTRKMGKIVFIHLNGKSAVKEEDRVTFETEAGPIPLSFPKYVIRRPKCRTSTLVVNSGDTTIRERAVLGEDINEIAFKNLKDKRVRIAAKTLARAVVKQLAINATADGLGGDNAGFLKLALNVVNTVAVEKADTRSWRTLPGEVYIARSFVPPGQCEISVEQCGAPVKSLETLNIKAGQTKFVIYYSIY